MKRVMAGYSSPRSTRVPQLTPRLWQRPISGSGRNTPSLRTVFGPPAAPSPTRIWASIRLYWSCFTACRACWALFTRAPNCYHSAGRLRSNGQIIWMACARMQPSQGRLENALAFSQPNYYRFPDRSCDAARHPVLLAKYFLLWIQSIDERPYSALAEHVAPAASPPTRSVGDSVSHPFQ